MEHTRHEKDVVPAPNYGEQGQGLVSKETLMAACRFAAAKLVDDAIDDVVSHDFDPQAVANRMRASAIVDGWANGELATWRLDRCLPELFGCERKDLPTVVDESSLADRLIAAALGIAAHEGNLTHEVWRQGRGRGLAQDIVAFGRERSPAERPRTSLRRRFDQLLEVEKLSVGYADPDEADELGKSMGIELSSDECSWIATCTAEDIRNANGGAAEELRDQISDQVSELMRGYVEEIAESREQEQVAIPTSEKTKEENEEALG